tara:strand:+ start:112 stop:1806 length:1695 start_codon:yes stop_codon:yes gene_type:complete
MFNDASKYSQSINNAVERQQEVSSARETLQDQALGVLKAKDAVIALTEGKWDRIGDMMGQGLLDAGIRGHGMQYYSSMIGKSAAKRFRNSRAGKALVKKIKESKIGKLGSKAVNKLTPEEHAQIQKGVDEGGIRGGAKEFTKISAKKGGNWFKRRFMKDYNKVFGGDEQDESDNASLTPKTLTAVEKLDAENDSIDATDAARGAAASASEAADSATISARTQLFSVNQDALDAEDAAKGASTSASSMADEAEESVRRAQIRTRPELSKTEEELSSRYKGQFGGVRDLTEEESVTRATGLARGAEVQFEKFEPRQVVNDTTQGTEDERFFSEFRRTAGEKPVRQRGETEGQFKGRVNTYNADEAKAGRKPFVPSDEEMREPTYTEQNQRETLHRMMNPEADHEDAAAAREVQAKTEGPAPRAASSAATKTIENDQKDIEQNLEKEEAETEGQRRADAGEPPIKTPIEREEEEEDNINKTIDGNNEDAETGGGGDGDDPFAGVLPLIGDAAIAGIGMGIMAITNWITGGRAAKQEKEDEESDQAAMAAASAQAVKEIPSISTQFGT